MVDWFDVIMHFLQISGLSVLLTTFGYHSWAGSLANPESYSGALPASGAPYYLGLLLVALGFLSNSAGWIERAGWGVVLLLSIVGLLSRGGWRAGKLR